VHDNLSHRIEFAYRPYLNVYMYTGDRCNRVSVLHQLIDWMSCWTQLWVKL